MESLYTFGVRTYEAMLSDGSWSQRYYEPVRIERASDIETVWASWSDFLFVFRYATGQLTGQYCGSNLTHMQANAAASAATDSRIKFFGQDACHGLRGFFLPDQIVIFSTALQRGLTSPSTPENETYRLKWGFQLQNISFRGTEGMIVTAMRPACAEKYRYHDGCPAAYSDPRMTRVQYRFRNMDDFKTWLKSENPPRPMPRGMCPNPEHNPVERARREASEDSLFPPPILDSPPRNLHPMDTFPLPAWSHEVRNAAVHTAIDSHGKVYTWTDDFRYMKCLGRTHDEDNLWCKPSPVPYLSEVEIVKIASGGWMTAAIDQDGELYLWGCSPQSAHDELAVLRGQDDRTKMPLQPLHRSSCELEDEQITVVELDINGAKAVATDVGVGLGHILVAAEAQSDDGTVQRAVFAAGCGDKGQLGLGYVTHFQSEFVEIPAFSGLAIKQLVCVGFSSFAVVRHENHAHKRRQSSEPASND